jgi:DNA-directed RNA polymerase delta subunit
MQGWKLARGRVARREIQQEEILHSFIRHFSTSPQRPTARRAGFVLSLLHSLEDVDSRGRLDFEPLFARLALLTWVLVLEHGLRQCGAGRGATAEEEVLLEAFRDFGGATSLASLPTAARADLQSAFRRVAKKYVVGAIYGDFRRAIYDFDLIDEDLRFHPTVLDYCRGKQTELVDRAIDAMSSQLGRYNNLSPAEVREVLQSALERIDLDGVRVAAGERQPLTSRAVGVYYRASESAEPGTIPERLLNLPIGVAIADPGATGRLAQAGRRTLRSVEKSSEYQLLEVSGLGRKTALRTHHLLEAIRSGRFDPTLCTASTLDEELRWLVERSGSSDVDRHVMILETYYGLRGEPELTLEEIATRIGVTRERVRQLKSQAEEGIEDLLPWVDLQSISKARVALGQIGGLATYTELGATVTEGIPSGDFDACRFLRWILARARDPLLCDVDGDLVVGPPLGFELFHRGCRTISNCLDENKCVSLETLAGRLQPEWPELAVELIAHHAALIAGRFGVMVMPGHFSAAAWSRADWAEFVLESEGRPLHYREVAERVNRLSGSDYNDVGFNGILNSNPRFVRVGAGDFALAEWGAKPYGRFDEVIERYLQEQEDPIREDVLTADLLKTYTVSPSTVAAMLRTASERFLHFGGGYWGLRSKVYRADYWLEDRIAAILNRTGPQTPEYVHQRICRLIQPLVTPPSLECVTRTLFVSTRFVRHGHIPPQRFRYVATQDAPSATETEGSESDSDAAVPPTADELFRAISW